MLNFLRKIIPNTHPLRLLYYKIVAFLGAVFYWFPADKMIVIAVTGTNGKTSVVNMLADIFEKAGYKYGMITTINWKIGGTDREVNATKQTTFGRFRMQKMLRQMVKEGCKYALLEVSSQAATQSRILGINIDVAVVTNVAPEHIEYHGGFNNYLSAKGKVFKKVSKGRKKFGVPKVLITNRDDKYFNYFDQFVADRKVNYGLGQATIFAAQVRKDAAGSHFVMHVPNNSIPVQLKIPGGFNVYNALAAASCAISLQVPLEVIKQGLESTTGIPGRFESVNAGQKYSVVVDYAHGPESLEHLFELYRGLTPGRLYAVFGATGGGRDVGKRPKMGEVADKMTDYVILTNDDPYDDEEWDIIDDVAKGVSREEGRNFWKVADRREAIRLALTMAHEGDTVIVAGKGCEEVMKLRGQTIPWNDKKVIEELLRREVEVEIGPSSWEKRGNVCMES